MGHNETMEIMGNMYLADLEGKKALVLNWLERGYIWDTLLEDWDGMDRSARLGVKPANMTLLCELLLTEGRISAYYPGRANQWICYCATSVLAGSKESTGYTHE